MQAGIMNINERKCTSASQQASQAIADSYFVCSGMDFVANVLSSILKALPCGKIVL